MVGAFFGAVAAAWQNSPKQAAVPISSTLRGIGGYAAFFGTAGGTYIGAVNTMAEFRQRKDPFNHLVGGALSGSLVGFARRSLTVGLASAALAGFGCAFADLVGNPANRTERGWKKLTGVIPPRQAM